MDNPLNPTDLKQIKDALYRLNDVGTLLDLLDKLGQDTSELREKVKFYVGVLTTLRTELFPDKP